MTDKNNNEGGIDEATARMCWVPTWLLEDGSRLVMVRFIIPQDTEAEADALGRAVERWVYVMYDMKRGPSLHVRTDAYGTLDLRGRKGLSANPMLGMKEEVFLFSGPLFDFDPENDGTPGDMFGVMKMATRN